MTPADHLRILGAETLAEIHLRVAAAPPPDAEVIAELRPILAPAYQELANASDQGLLEAA